MNSLPLSIETPSGEIVRLNRERWRHIVNHGELVGNQDELVECIKNPDDTVPDTSDSDVELFYKESEKIYSDYICAVVNVVEGFVITAYGTSSKKS